MGWGGRVRCAYVFRLRPTACQHVALAACVDAHRELYNAALQERRDGWSHSKTRITYGDQSAQLSDIRVVRPDQAGKTPGYPRFKGTARFHSVEWPKDGDGARWRPDTRRVYLQGIGQVKVRVHRAVRGRVKTIQIKRQGRYWMLVLSCDDVPASPLPATGRQAGVDVGIASFATTSDAEHIDNPPLGA